MTVGPVKVDEQPDLTDREKAVARVLSDPGQYVRRRYWPDGIGGTEYEALHIWQARALLADKAARCELTLPPDEHESLKELLSGAADTIAALRAALGRRLSPPDGA